MKIYQHIIFWLVVHVSLTLIFGSWFESYVESFYYVSLLLPVVMGTSYFFNYFLVPRYLFTRKFFHFGLYSVYMFIVSLAMELAASVAAMLIIIKFNISKNGPLVTDVFTMAMILYFVVLFKSFLLLIRHYYKDQLAIGNLEQEKEKLDRGYLTVNSQRRKSRLAFDEIRYVESLADYVKFHLADGGVVQSKAKISHVERDLPGVFLRIHRSFIVNCRYISGFSREEVTIGGQGLPVSRTYRGRVIERLGGESHAD